MKLLQRYESKYTRPDLHDIHLVTQSSTFTSRTDVLSFCSLNSCPKPSAKSWPWKSERRRSRRQGGRQSLLLQAISQYEMATVILPHCLLGTEREGLGSQRMVPTDHLIILYPRVPEVDGMARYLLDLRQCAPRNPTRTMIWLLHHFPRHRSSIPQPLNRKSGLLLKKLSTI